MLAHWVGRFTHQKQLALNIAVILVALACLYPGVSQASMNDSYTQVRQLAQLAEYIAVDYVEAVRDGQVINNDEYQEMLEFSQLIVTKVSAIQNERTKGAELATQANALQDAIQKKQDTETIRQMSSSLRGTLLALMPQSALPDRLLPKTSVKQLFESQCASCHGASGGGDGVLAAQLNPVPTDFSDRERALNRSLLGLYDAISRGIDETAMPAFDQLSEQERWSLAFHVGSLAFQSGSPVAGEASNVTLQQLVNHNPAQLAADLPEVSLQTVEDLRANPELLFEVSADPLEITREQLLLAQAAHQRGDYQAAQTLAVSAYLDGFELIENGLDAQDKALRRTLEVDMMAMRQLMKQPQAAGVVEAAVNQILMQLDDADRLLSESTLSNVTLFSASLFILLREGLEALLVVIAMVTVLVRTGRKDGLRYVHLGWVAALLAGVATWAAAQSLISISGASREVMEGVAALLAVLVLLYVGIWMHSKTHAAQWQAYIQQHINTHLTSGTLWGLALLAFIVVYREVFETVLFYQALLTQTASTQYPSVIGGFSLGVAFLLILAWALARYSVKLPIAKFFSITTYLLLVLAFILMGKAVSALQEAALLGITPLPVSFEIDWVGVKSNWQGILAQLSVLLVFMLAAGSRKKASCATSRTSDFENPGVAPSKPD